MQGDVDIEGGIQGTGAIFATGNITVSGAIDLQPADVAALVAEGRIILDGVEPPAPRLR